VMRQVLEQNIENIAVPRSSTQKPYWKLEELYHITDQDKKQMQHLSEEQKQEYIEDRILDDHIERYQYFTEDNSNRDMDEVKYLTSLFWLDRPEAPQVNELDTLTIAAMYKRVKDERSRVLLAEWIQQHKYCVAQDQMKHLASMAETIDARLAITSLLSCDVPWEKTKKNWKNLRHKELTEKGVNFDGSGFDRSLYFDRPADELGHGKAVYKPLPDELTPPDSVVELARKNNMFANAEPPKPNPKPLRRGPLFKGTEDPRVVPYDRIYKELTGSDSFPTGVNSPAILSRANRFLRGFGWGDL